jgi:hypothetical protein
VAETLLLLPVLLPLLVVLVLKTMARLLLLL